MRSSGAHPPVVLVVLDGWGLAPPGPGNAVELARTPVFDRLWSTCPRTQLDASGEAVGLPPGQMGNSEVGHLTIGSGRVLYQDLMRVNTAIESGSFYENPALLGAFDRVRARGSRLHLLGLVSRGGVHSHIDHLKALLELARRQGLGERTFVHAFTDGRDVSPGAAERDLAELPAARLATVAGRYYAMDRDGRWDRTDRALAALLHGGDEHAADAVTAMRASTARGITDEFVEPTVIDGRPRIAPGDAAIFFNFRSDRGRQLSERLLAAGIDLTTMTRYSEDLDCPVAFGEQQVVGTLAQALSDRGLRQLHAAETEKYAHVTYFLNGGREEEWPGETRILVPSPRDVPSYDLKPEMSAPELARRFAAEVGEGYAFGIVNFANPDMVGHTGVIAAAIRAVEAADAGLGTVVRAVDAAGGVCLVTADHGNAEEMLEDDGTPNTAHSTNPVPLVATGTNGAALASGTLSDLAPTVLALLGVARPPQMTGSPLL
ncbi:MAG: 2,3-bisphosphoglycerate-independent phosphoglycerate mutase [Actinobacteria bacterium]|nr:2,3-bisphosphoglycerate-independent phosphoglycerate mutase [Actinomycetota bacterium]